MSSQRDSDARPRPELIPAWNKLSALFEDVFDHSGFGEIRISVRWLSKGRKEVILASGKEYRFVIPAKSPEIEEDQSA